MATVADLHLATDADSIAAAQDRHPSAYARGRAAGRAEEWRLIVDWLAAEANTLEAVADTDRTRALAEEASRIYTAIVSREHLRGE